MTEIKILGSGCAKCKRLQMMAEKAVETLNIEANITKVTEYDEIMKYPILSTPGMVINEKLVSSGKLPSQMEVTNLISTEL